MSTFIVVAAFSPETDLPQMSAVIGEEGAQVAALTSEGRLGAVHVSPSRGRVFLEVRADDESAARDTVESLPMARWWSLEVYPTMAPPSPAAGS